MERYMGYLESSQNIRRLIPIAGLLDLVNRSLKTKPLGSNSSHRVHKLENDLRLPLAIRSCILGAEFEYIHADLEYCARKYAEYCGGLFRVPNFSIGMKLHGMPYLLTEDLTFAGNIIIPTDDHGGVLEPSGERTLFDFGLEDGDINPYKRDKIMREMLNPSLFFSNGNAIELK